MPLLLEGFRRASKSVGGHRYQVLTPAHPVRSLVLNRHPKWTRRHLKNKDAPFGMTNFLCINTKT